MTFFFSILFFFFGECSQPPWGKGPVQGQIHGHPEYIDNEFPLTDKFLECHVERINNGGGSEKLDSAGANTAARKEDVQQPDRVLQEQKERQHHRDMRTPEMFEAQRQIMKEQAMAGKTSSTHVAAIALIALGALAVMFMLLKNRRKVSSKTS
jgi:hypothetical protein